RPRDKLEYHLVWRVTSPLAANHFWFEHDFFEPGALIVLNEQLEVNIPRDSKVKLKVEPGKDPNIKEENDRRIYSWSYASLKRITKDEKEEAKKKKQNEDDEPKPAQVQMTTFQSWAEVGNWYETLERERVTPDDRIRAKADELTREKTTEKEQTQP